MGLFDKLKELAPQVAERLDDLNLDDKIADAMEGLVNKLEALKEQSQLDDKAAEALASFKPKLESFKDASEDKLEDLLAGAKELVAKLSNADLPDEIEGLIAKVKAFFD